MNKLIVRWSFAAVLSSGIFSLGACSSTSTNTVSSGNINHVGAANTSGNAAVNRPSAMSAENVNPTSANPTQGNSTADLRPPSRQAETASSETLKTEKVGVPECDDYIAKYETCLTTKVPEAQRAVFSSSMETMRKGWRNAATNPQAKAALAGGCKVALQTAKESMSAFSCDW